MMLQAIMPHATGRRSRRLLLSTLVALACLLLGAPGRADAHPLGNFTINHFSEIVVGQQKISVRYIVDLAEIPSVQLLQVADSNADKQVDESEKAALLERESQRLTQGLTLGSGEQHLTLALADRSIAIIPGQGGLPTVRIELLLEAMSPAMSATAGFDYRDANDPDRIGWREIIVRNADGVRVSEASVPAESVSDELRNYPTDLLNSPLDERSATFRAILDPAARSTVRSANTLNPGSAPVVDQLQTLTAGELTPGVIVIAIAVAFVLGAGHALTPGHGKTIVAAYLVGSRGTPRHAVILGLTTTITHTAGVFALGLITLFAAHFIVPERIFPWLELISGVLVVGIGVMLLRQRAGSVLRQLRLRARGRVNLAFAHAPGGAVTHFAGKPEPRGHAPHVHATHHSHHAGHADDHTHGPDTHTHDHDAQHSHDHAHDHAHEPHTHDHDAQHSHDHAHDHEHGPHTHTHDHDHVLADWIAGHRDEAPTQPSGAVTTRSLIGLGISGGLLPCPSALVLLLGAIALGRVGFGLFLTVVFSLGLASVLTGIGLLLVLAGRWFERFPTGGLALRLVPILSAVFVTLIGIGLTISAVGRLAG